jgi:transposase InsO family protein
MPSDRAIEAGGPISGRSPGGRAMASDEDAGRRHDRWAHLRFAVIGALLAAPPKKGDLQPALTALAARAWQQPIRGEPVRFAFSTLERWYYHARHAATDPVGRWRRRLRRDAGQQPSIGERLREAVRAQDAAHRSWSYQLHVDNLRVLVEADATLGPLPSYTTVRRYMQAQGLLRQRRRTARDRPGSDRVAVARQPREVRSYEVEYVGGLWHADFHHASLKVLTASGTWVTPVLLAVLDDHSRLCCHAQWYLAETAATFVHGLCQAIQKRGLSRALLTDNGGPMTAAETREGLGRLGISHMTTLPYSPYQNAKQEIFGRKLKAGFSRCWKAWPPISGWRSSMKPPRRGSNSSITALGIRRRSRRRSPGFSPARTSSAPVGRPTPCAQRSPPSRRARTGAPTARSPSRACASRCRRGSRICHA